MSTPKTHVETLQDAGVLKPEHCSEAHKAAINMLSSEEVATLIQVKKKVNEFLDEGTHDAQTAGRPWCL